MKLLSILAPSCVLLGSVLTAWPQAGPKLSGSPAQTLTHLSVDKTVKAAEIATPFVVPIKCGGDGDIYLQTESDGVPAIHKFAQSGERLAVFGASSCADIQVQISGQFAIAADGRIYQIEFPTERPNRYVFVFNSDGTCHSYIKIDTGFAFVPYQIAVFPSGNMLIAGLRWSADRKVKAMWPYTALFNSSGTVLKEIDLEDDVEIHKLGAQGDPRVTSTGDPNGNTAVTRGVMEAGSDGNIYLIRRLSPAIVYAISEGGVVVRRFVVDPGNAGLLPSSMQLGANRLAILFRDGRTNTIVLKVVDLQGNELATFDEGLDQGKPELGLAFACYSYPPDRFTFLTTFDDGRLGFKIAEHR